MAATFAVETGWGAFNAQLSIKSFVTGLGVRNLQHHIQLVSATPDSNEAALRCSETLSSRLRCACHLPITISEDADNNILPWRVPLLRRQKSLQQCVSVAISCLLTISTLLKCRRKRMVRYDVCMWVPLHKRRLITAYSLKLQTYKCHKHLLNKFARVEGVIALLECDVWASADQNASKWDWVNIAIADQFSNEVGRFSKYLNEISIDLTVTICNYWYNDHKHRLSINRYCNGWAVTWYWHLYEVSIRVIL